MSNFIVALTGGIGSGKSTVAKIFADLEITIIDADEIAHELTKPNTPFFKKIVDHFEQPILKEDGTLDRKKLRDIIFDDTSEKEWLESLLHSEIWKLLFERAKNAKSPYVILVIPLLIEALKKEENFGFFVRKNINHILVVTCSTDLQKKRAKSRSHLNDQTINKILEAQATQEERIELADDLIKNNGNLETLRKSVFSLHKRYLSQAKNS